MRKRAGADDLSDLVGRPLDAAAEGRLHGVLRNGASPTVARAARIVREQQLEGFSVDLVAAFERMQRNAPKTDPGCVAQLAIVEALDFADHPDPAPFLAAARRVQLEPSWGPPVDSAGPVRARGALALANLGYPDILLIAGELLVDAEPAVRQAAADAVAHCGARHGAGLLSMAASREDDPSVQLACLSGMLTLAPDYSLPRLRARLESRDHEAREAAAIALGQSSRDDALDLLLEFVDASPLSTDRAVILSALGLHRSERALQTLIDVIVDGSRPGALSAVAALRVQRFDPRVRQRVEGAVEKRADAVVREAARDALAEP